ncbi:unnamed protein product [Parnassius mnemosyne]|uniref:Reverse transcriptase domain-containing protein n=1 Tax=Parnassius mnemosyne TaxID=213953 RepID=A0AAV1K706_9NEOP
MWLNIKINGKSLVFGTAYRPPWLSVTLFLDALSESLGSFVGYDQTVLLGDFNIDILNKNCVSTKMLSDFLTCNNLVQYVEEPTHFTEYSETLLDVICSDASVSYISVDYISDLSSHAFIVCELDIPKPKFQPESVTYRSLRDIDINLFNQDLKQINWHCALSHNINDMIDSFNKKLLNIFNFHAPPKTVYIKKKYYPWITHNIRCMMRTSNEAQVRARKTKLAPHKDYYRELKSIVNKAIVSEKIAYFKFYINSKLNQPKIMWKHIKHQVQIKSKDTSLPSHFSDPDALNNHFLNIPGKNEVSLSLLTFFEFNGTNGNSFYFKEASEDEVVKVINSLQSNAVGCDGISLDMLKLLPKDVITEITYIINKSFATNTYPDVWKKAIVKPIPKTSNPVSMSDLRPISILPCLSKIIEKLACNQLTKYLEANNILPELQSGFRKKHSTTTALIEVVDDILTAQASGEGTILTLLDFSRAFETLNIPLLLSKLYFYGLSRNATQWFASYFKNRSQQVEIQLNGKGKTISGERPVNRGVPQGSILGPLLFIIYSADIIKNIEYCKYHMYADDLQIYISV